MKEPFDIGNSEQPWQKWGRQIGRLSGFTVVVILLVIVGIWLASGFYTVQPSEIGLVKQFGKYTATTGPGFNYHWPAPIESVVIVDQSNVRTEEIGFQSRSGVPSTQFPTNPEEALMLTGDFNIISVEMVIQYSIIDTQKFAFQLEDYRTLIREAAQAIIRERVATSTVDQALTDQREEIANEALKELQALLDQYGAGIHINNVRLQEVTPPTKSVAQAFDDVNSAAQDKERAILDAQKYSNEQLPVAEGAKQRILNEADAYKQSRILQAQGNVARFLSILGRYKLGPSVTEDRLYIETMEEVLPGMNKIIVPAADGSGVISLLNLEQLLKGAGK